MAFGKYLLIATAVLGLAACTTGQEDDAAGTGSGRLAELAKAPRKGNDFTQALANQYQALATDEYRSMGDYVDADYFAKKGLRAASGVEVAPEDPRDWDMSDATRKEMTIARTYLIDAFKKGSKSFAPVGSATAQAKFDCWVEEEEEAVQAKRVAACKSAYARALASLREELKLKAAVAKPAKTRAPAPKPQAAPQPEPVTPDRQVLVILFDTGSTRLSSEAIIALESLAVNIMDSPAGRALVIGHADRSGTSQQNDVLSQERAAAVVTALVNAGAPAEQVAMTWRGDSDPAVSDATASVENRRVVVIVQGVES